MTAPPAGLRIGDAERLAAAERLASHFSHGRLDQAELDDRLGLAMRARTAADLTALFADLPQAEEVPAGVVNSGRRELPPAAPPPRPPRAPRRGGRIVRGLVLAVLLVAAVAVVANVVHSSVAWALLLIVGLLWLSRRRVRH